MMRTYQSIADQVLRIAILSTLLSVQLLHVDAIYAEPPTTLNVTQSPKEALKLFVQALDGDTQAYVSVMKYDDIPTGLSRGVKAQAGVAFDTLGRRSEAWAKCKYEIRQKIGNVDLSQLADSSHPSVLKEISNAKLEYSEDQTRVRVSGQQWSYDLVKRDDKWRVSLLSFVQQENARFPKGFVARTIAISMVTDEIKAGRYRDLDAIRSRIEDLSGEYDRIMESAAKPVGGNK